MPKPLWNTVLAVLSAAELRNPVVRMSFPFKKKSPKSRSILLESNPKNLDPSYNPKNLDPGNKKDIDFWDHFGGGNPHLIPYLFSCKAGLSSLE